MATPFPQVKKSSNAKPKLPKELKARVGKSMANLLQFLHGHVHALNNSKLFAGLMIIVLNISSKFVNIKLSKSMESYLRHTFSRDILIFAIAWMGTRDIYIALIISLIFIILMDFLLHEDSMFCCLPQQFRDHHISLLDSSNNAIGGLDANKVSDEDIKRAQAVLEKANTQNALMGGSFRQQVNTASDIMRF
jgi:hypothetical protein